MSCAPSHKNEVHNSLISLAKESQIIQNNLERDQFGQFSTKISEFEELTSMVNEKLVGPQDSFEGLAREAESFVDRMEKEQATQRAGGQDMGMHMSNTLHGLRSALQIDQLADDLHLLSQIALRFQQQGRETLTQMHKDLEQCHRLSERAPGIVAGIPHTCAPACSNPSDHFVKLEQRAERFALAADYQKLMASLSNLMTTLAEVDIAALVKHHATIQSFCFALDNLQRTISSHHNVKTIIGSQQKNGEGSTVYVTSVVQRNGQGNTQSNYESEMVYT